MGETLGHFVRALAIAEQVEATGAEAVVAASAQWRGRYPDSPNVRVEPLDWEFSHNNLPTAPIDVFYRSAASLEAVIADVQPDLVVGDPGIFSMQVARALGVPHYSVMHTAWLAPLLSLPRPSIDEHRILEFAVSSISGLVDPIFESLHRMLDLPQCSYSEILASENIFAVQPPGSLVERRGMNVTGFVPATMGPPAEMSDGELQDACFVSFGQGTTADITPIVRATAAVFPRVLVAVNRARLGKVPPNVIVKDIVGVSSVAGRVRAAVTHGGIGLVAALAVAGTPQVIVPTDLTQATMAVVGARLGFALSCGLGAWAASLQLGRRLPEIPYDEMRKALEAAADGIGARRDIDGTGATVIARAVGRATAEDHA